MSLLQRIAHGNGDPTRNEQAAQFLRDCGHRPEQETASRLANLLLQKQETKETIVATHQFEKIVEGTPGIESVVVELRINFQAEEGR